MEKTLKYIDSKIAAHNKASREGGPSTRVEHQYAAQVLGALRGDLWAGLHLDNESDK